MDRGAWQASVHGVANSWTQLRDFHFTHYSKSGPQISSWDIMKKLVRNVDLRFHFQIRICILTLSQRVARRNKEVFLSNQCKEIEENNKMGKTRDLFKKIRDTKGTVHAKMGSIKDRNSMDLTEAEDIKKRWQEYTEELYKKDLHDQDNHDGAITHLEPDILECEVKWALESITTNKASGGDGIPVLFQ